MLGPWSDIMKLKAVLVSKLLLSVDTILSDSVPITTNVVSLNPSHGEVYSIQLYVIKFVSELWQVGGSPRYSQNIIFQFNSLNFFLIFKQYIPDI
jgi:hypothetical protein